MWYVVWTLSFMFICLTHAFIDEKLIICFFKTKKLSHNFVFTCQQNKEQIRMLRKLTSDYPMMLSLKHINKVNIFDDLVINYKRVGVVLDADCETAHKLLNKRHRYKVFDTKHFWLVLHKSRNYLSLFKEVNFNVDSDVKVVFPSQLNSSDITYFIDDVYNQGFRKGGKLISLRMGFYGLMSGYQIKETRNKYFIRKNLSGVHFNSVIVLPEPFDGTLDDYLVNDRQAEVNTLNRFHARLMHNCKEYYNYSVTIEVEKSWGIFNKDRTMDGLVGALERKVVDFGSSPLIAKKERREFMSYGKNAWPLRMAFMFRNPTSKQSYQIFTKPLALEVWICIVISSVFIIAAQRLSYGFDHMKLRDETFVCTQTNRENYWSLSALSTFAAFCQQGIVSFPNSTSGRIAAFIALLLGLLIYQFYSAILVSFLLNIPGAGINAVEDILISGFGIGFEDVLYATALLRETNSDVAKEVLRRVSTLNDSGFLTREVGLKLVEKGHYAFHVELVTAYPFIEKRYDYSMICELKAIPLFPPMFMYANYQKWSPFKDIMDVCLQRLSENGVVNRELIFWHPRKPDCVRSSSTISIHTGIEDFYPALVVLFCGIVLSLQILLLEILWHSKWCYKKKTVFPYTE